MTNIAINKPKPGSLPTTTTTTQMPPPTARTKRRITREPTEEDAITVQAFLHLLETISPSQKLAKLLVNKTISPELAHRFIVEINQHQIYIDQHVLHVLFSKLTPELAKDCLKRLTLSTKKTYTPFVRKFCTLYFQKPPLMPSSCPTQPAAIQQKPSPITVNISGQTSSTSGADALQQIFYYASKIIRQRFQEPPLLPLPEDPWFLRFINDLAPLHVTDTTSLKTLVDKTHFDKYPVKKSLRAFLNGTWEPEQRNVRELTIAVLNTRAEIRRQALLCLHPPESLSTVFQQINEMVSSGRFRETFSHIRTEQELLIGEQLLQNHDLLLHGAANCLSRKKTLKISSKFKATSPLILPEETPSLWVMKIYPSTTESVNVTIATPIASGTRKMVSLVASIDGRPPHPFLPWPVYAYATSKSVPKKSYIENLKWKLLQADATGDTKASKELSKALRQINKSIERNRAALERTVQVSTRLGITTAIHSIPFFKKTSPSPIKGIAMEYLRHTLLSFDTTPMEMPERLAMAIDLCKAVARMHDQCRTVHLDLSFKNVLCQKWLFGVAIRLCDFDTSENLDTQPTATQNTATYPPPEMMIASPSNPIKVGPWTDNWSLGLLLTKIIFGGDDWALIAKTNSSASEREISSLLEDKRKEFHPSIIQAIQGLLTYNHLERWHAQMTQGALENALRDVQQ